MKPVKVTMIANARTQMINEIGNALDTGAEIERNGYKIVKVGDTRKTAFAYTATNVATGAIRDELSFSEVIELVNGEIAF